MRSVPHRVGAAATSARSREQEPSPGVEVKLPADRRAAFRARGEIHRLLQRWEVDDAGRTMRFEFRTEMSNRKTA